MAGTRSAAPASPEPAIDRVGSSSVASASFNWQPRLLFSMPYNAALGVLGTPGGKWMPLMKRTVRVDSGASALLNIAAARAVVTATSGPVGDAPGRASTPRIRPPRSTTATDNVFELIAPADARSAANTSSALKVGSAAVTCDSTRPPWNADRLRMRIAAAALDSQL